jgi:hypothetical protein
VPPQGLEAREARTGRELAPALREAAEAGLRYYGRLGRLALDLAAVLAPDAVELRPRRDRAPAPEPAAAPTEPGPEPARTIVIEAEAGKRGLGVFMVENTTAEPVRGALSVSAFGGPGRKKVRPEIAFAPDAIALDPGDQVLVQVAASVDETFEPGVRYAAEIRVPTLSGAGIPLVVRRGGGARTRKKTAKAAATRSAARPKGQARRR